MSQVIDDILKFGEAIRDDACEAESLTSDIAYKLQRLLAATEGALEERDALKASVERLEREREEMRTVLRDIVNGWNPRFGLLERSLIERAEKLLAGG